MYETFVRRFNKLKSGDSSPEQFITDLSELVKYFQNELLSERNDFDIINQDFSSDEDNLFERRGKYLNENKDLSEKKSPGLLNELAKKFFSKSPRLKKIEEAIKKLNSIRWTLVNHSPSDEEFLLKKTYILSEIQSIEYLLESKNL